MWALYVFRMMNMPLHLQRSRGDQSMRVRMRMMKGTREKLTWSHLAQPPQPPQPMDTEPAALTLRDVHASDYMALVTMDFLCSQMASTATT